MLDLLSQAVGLQPGQGLAHPVVHTLDVDGDVAAVYAEIILGLRRKGTAIPTNDAWIAACAVRAGATLVTYDHHFEAIDLVGVVLLDA